MDFINTIIMVIQMIIFIFLYFIFMLEGIEKYKKIFPIRYGKKHMELQGKVIGEKSLLVDGRFVECPILEFFYQDTKYMAFDYTCKNRKYKEGDFLTICFNPDFSNSIIIKRRFLDINTIIWFYMFVLGILCITLAIIMLVCLIEGMVIVVRR